MWGEVWDQREHDPHTHIPPPSAHSPCCVTHSRVPVTTASPNLQPPSPPSCAFMPLLSPSQLREARADVLLVTMLDEVAWLLNLRGSDVECNPVFLSYVLVPLDGPARLYVDWAKVPEPVREHLKVCGGDV